MLRRGAVVGGLALSFVFGCGAREVDLPPAQVRDALREEIKREVKSVSFLACIRMPPDRFPNPTYKCQVGAEGIYHDNVLVHRRPDGKFEWEDKSQSGADLEGGEIAVGS